MDAVITPARWAGLAAVVLVAVVVGWTPAPNGLTSARALLPAPDLSAGGAEVREPWRPGQPELGVQVYWIDDPSVPPEVVRERAHRVVDYVVGLDANAISISFPFYANTITASHVAGDFTTPSPERLEVVVTTAQRSGLRVSLRPLIDESNLVRADPRDWRGALAPVDRDAWFASYRTFLAPYLELAERTGIDSVVLATELSSLQGDPRWGPLVEHARTVYRGRLGYAANWDAFLDARSTFPADLIGVDAYPPFTLGDSASPDDLVAAWEEWLDTAVLAPVATEAGAPAPVLYEVGIAGQAGAYRRPFLPPDPDEALRAPLQERWFTAACAAARNRDLAGLYWWFVDFRIDPAVADPVQDRNDSFIGRPAEQAVRDCFTGWATR